MPLWHVACIAHTLLQVIRPEVAASIQEEFSAVAFVQITGSMANVKREVAACDAIHQVMPLSTPNNQGAISFQTAALVPRLLDHQVISYKQGVPKYHGDVDLICTDHHKLSALLACTR